MSKNSDIAAPTQIVAAIAIFLVIFGACGALSAILTYKPRERSPFLHSVMG